VAPLWLGGLRGKQSTPSIGWEVPVRSRRSASGSGTECVDDTQSRKKAMVRSLICRVECIRVYD
jgi:hypothetical protein